MIQFLRRGGAALGAALFAVLLTGLLTGAPARADRQRDAQWYVAPMKLPEAQKLGKGGEGVVVAVIDTGVDTKHQDLRGAAVPGRYTAVNGPDDDLDSGPHGTGMAGLIAGRGHGSGDGLLGVAPRSKVMPIRPVADGVLIADGIRWAIDNGAKVINMSFQLELESDVVARAIAEAVAADVVVVAAVGNDGGEVDEPAVFPGALGVGSVDRNNRVSSFSNRGEGVDLVTYGSVMPVAAPGNKYGRSEGTSNSAALVSGVAALMRARYPDMSAAEVVDRLTGTAVDRGAQGRDNLYGHGQLDVIAALTAPRTPPSKAPVTATATPGLPADGPPIVSEPIVERRGIPPFLIIGFGLLLLILALAALMILRARRNR
ncbi:S8 family peptidase [Paractinoplanes rishiriensis]|uniref:Peptidase S8/S53 domain-containing protein n=1 Tax=Paractinoplanes rishiriensis TaxID=1050105 RepID=A0A919K548_9ACTN|nr:S8 family serine peptidase [Actinoplanes rishiriensis]GIE99012.1 hypothetical protein Ari01nite_64770 [Actinoplanes rishiriensis]